MKNQKPTWLLEHKKDVHSQTGEDGIIEKILELLPARDSWCVEFGAWDGAYFCNTRYLIENKGYAAVLIEGDAVKSVELQKNYAHNPKVIAKNAYVGFHAHDNLDTLLRDLPIPRDFDFLSIDIDGNDLHVWKAVTTYRPKLVCIEFNPTIPTEVDFVQPADPVINQGASLQALVRLGKEKGYELISVLPFNAFFVEAKYFPLFGISDNRPETLRVDTSGITYLFSGYDGTVFLRGSGRLLWHEIPLRESRVQALPRILRKYPPQYTSKERKLFDLLRKWKWL